MPSPARSTEHSGFARRIVALWRNWNSCVRPDYSVDGEGKKAHEPSANGKGELSVVPGKWPSAPVALSASPQEINE